MTGHLQELTPVLIVDDLVPTRAFFADRLGFHVVAEVEHEGKPGFCMLQRDDVTLMIQTDKSLRDDAGENYVPGPYKASLYITVDSVEAIVPSVADADVVLPLRKTGYGMHEIGVREPAGNIVVFAARLS